MTKDLIVARYKEDMKWLEDARLKDWNVILYNKGNSKKGIKLENIGREAHTYLHHIITNYDKLSDINTFVQGHPFDHCLNFLDKLQNCDGEYYDFDVLNTKNRIEDNMVMRMGVPMFTWMYPDNHLSNRCDSCVNNRNKPGCILNTEIENDKIIKCDNYKSLVHDLHEILDMLNDPALNLYRRNKMAPIVDVSHYAIFSISRDAIRKYKIELYHKLLNHTLAHENGAYTLELLWRQLFA